MNTTEPPTVAIKRIPFIEVDVEFHTSFFASCARRCISRCMWAKAHSARRCEAPRERSALRSVHLYARTSAIVSMFCCIEKLWLLGCIYARFRELRLA